VILDHTGTPFPEKPVGQQYAEASARSARDTLYWLTVNTYAGWTDAQHRHWVETGEEPQ
jgi:hypothetical protein